MDETEQENEEWVNSNSLRTSYSSGVHNTWSADQFQSVVLAGPGRGDRSPTPSHAQIHACPLPIHGCTHIHSCMHAETHTCSHVHMDAHTHTLIHAHMPPQMYSRTDTHPCTHAKPVTAVKKVGDHCYSGIYPIEMTYPIEKEIFQIKLVRISHFLLVTL